MPHLPHYRLWKWLGSVAVAVVVSGACVWLLGSASADNLTAAVITGAALVGGSHLFGRLRPHLGRATTVALFALAGAAILGGWALVSPVCPGATVGRCTTAETATWFLSGALLPVSYLILVGVPVAGGIALWRAGCRLTHWMRVRRQSR